MYLLLKLTDTAFRLVTHDRREINSPDFSTEGEALEWACDHYPGLWVLTTYSGSRVFKRWYYVVRVENDRYWGKEQASVDAIAAMNDAQQFTWQQAKDFQTEYQDGRDTVICWIESRIVSCHTL